MWLFVFRRSRLKFDPIHSLILLNSRTEGRATVQTNMEVIAKSNWPRECNLNSGVLLTPLDLVQVIILLCTEATIFTVRTRRLALQWHCLEGQAIE
jgi:hypothetical protein